MKNILEKINRSTLKFLEPLTIDKTYKTIVDEGAKLVGAEYGSVIIPKKGEFKIVYTSNKSNYFIKVRKKGFAYKTLAEGKSFIVYRKDILKTHPEARNIRNLSFIFVPLSYQNKRVGVLIIRSNKNKIFTSKELEILNLFGSLASLAIRKTLLYDETKQALNTRDLFISMASHELRTPLTSIHGYIQLLHDRLASDKSSEGKWVKSLLWESIRLNNLVNELLAINRIKSGQLQYYFKECSLKEIIARSLTNFKFVHGDREVVFSDNSKNGSDMVIGDFDKLIQVVTNLLDNAAKFSPPQKEIIVNLKHSFSNIVIEIIDQGKGISEKDIPKVFNEFYRGKNAGHEGMGLGLFLAKHVINEHKGSINIESKTNEGTKLIIKLPSR